VIDATHCANDNAAEGTPAHIQRLLLEAFKTDIGMRGIGGPKGYRSAHPTICLTIEEVVEIEEERKWLDDLEDMIAGIIDEKRGDGVKKSFKEIAADLFGRVPLPPGDHRMAFVPGETPAHRNARLVTLLHSREWTADRVADFLLNRETKGKIAKPSKPEIAEMERRFEWMTRYVLHVDSQAFFSLRAWMMTERKGGSHRKAARELKIAIQTHLDRKNRALRIICEGLSTVRLGEKKPGAINQ
jgi:hypothetical protein